MARGFSFRTMTPGDFAQLTASRQAFERDRIQGIKDVMKDVSSAVIERRIAKKYDDPQGLEAMRERQTAYAGIDPTRSEQARKYINDAISAAYQQQEAQDKKIRLDLAIAKAGREKTEFEERGKLDEGKFAKLTGPLVEAYENIIKSDPNINKSVEKIAKGVGGFFGIGAEGKVDKDELTSAIAAQAVQRLSNDPRQDVRTIIKEIVKEYEANSSQGSAGKQKTASTQTNEDQNNDPFKEIDS